MDTNPALISMLERRVQACVDALAGLERDPVAMRKANANLRNARLSLARAKGSHTRSQWDALVAETGGFCVRCGYDHEAYGQQPCKSYITPLAAGGSNAIENILPLCRQCAVSRKLGEPDWLALWREQHPAEE